MTATKLKTIFFVALISFFILAAFPAYAWDGNASGEVAWAAKQVGETGWYTPSGVWWESIDSDGTAWCAKFVANAFGAETAGGNAVDLKNEMKNAGLLRTSVLTAAPVGALVFFNWTQWGHVGVHVGSGYVVHAGFSERVRKDYYSSIGKYAGWAYPPFSRWPGRPDPVSLPTVEVTSPKTGSWLSADTISITATATNASRVTFRVWYLSNPAVPSSGAWHELGTDISSSGGWTWSWPARDVPDQSLVKIQATAYGSAGTDVDENQIGIDRTPPSGSISINNGAEYTKTTSASISSLVTELSGLNEIMLSNTNDFVGAVWHSARMHPNGTAIKGSGPAVYLIRDGKKCAFPKPAVLESWISWDEVVNVPDSELLNYAYGEKLGFRDGSLIRQTGTPTVYSIEHGIRRPFTNAATFDSLHYSWSNIRDVSEAEVNLHPKGPSITDTTKHPDGTFVRGSGDAVYLIYDGMKRWVRSRAIVESYAGWDEIVTISDAELQSYPTGAPLCFRDGTLIRQAGTATVYLVSDGQRRSFPSASVFNALNYSWEQILDVTQSEVESQPKGEGIKENPPIPWALTSVAGNKTVYAKLKDRAGNISSVASDSIVLDDSAPSVSNLRPPDGTAVGKFKPALSADYSDSVSGIDVSTARIYLDGLDKTSEATVTEISIAHIPATALSEGLHIVKVTVSDKAGNPAEANWSFKILYGDVNGSGKVDIFDLVIVAKAFGSKLGDPNWNSAADLNGDLTVDIFDLVIVAKNFGNSL